MSTPALETPRLLLRPLELADATQAQVLFPVWEVVRYMAPAVPWPYPADGALTFYRDVALPAMARSEAWHWTLRQRSDPGQLMGSISLQRGEGENRGFWLGVPWRRQGLMTEACQAATRFWFEVLRFPVLRVSKAVANEGSRRISQRQGFRVVALEDRDFLSGRQPAEVSELTAEAWRARVAPPHARPQDPGEPSGGAT
jgi:RimJ/RimL family protein N-acetyltransferase